MSKYLLSITLISIICISACNKRNTPRQKTCEASAEELSIFPTQPSSSKTEIEEINEIQLVASLDELPIPINGKKHSTELVVWKREGLCKQRIVLCHKDWDQIPEPDHDTCFPLIGEKEKSELNIPKSAYFIYSVGSMESSGELTVSSAIYDTGDGSEISELPICM